MKFMKKSERMYKIELVSEYKDEFKNDKSTYLVDLIEAESLKDAYSDASKIAADLNKQGDLAFRVVAVERA